MWLIPRDAGSIVQIADTWQLAYTLQRNSAHFASMVSPSLQGSPDSYAQYLSSFEHWTSNVATGIDCTESNE